MKLKASYVVTAAKRDCISWEKMFRFREIMRFRFVTRTGWCRLATHLIRSVNLFCFHFCFLCSMFSFLLWYMHIWCWFCLLKLLCMNTIKCLEDSIIFFFLLLLVKWPLKEFKKFLLMARFYLIQRHTMPFVFSDTHLLLVDYGFVWNCALYGTNEKSVWTMVLVIFCYKNIDGVQEYLDWMDAELN